MKIKVHRGGGFGNGGFDTEGGNLYGGTFLIGNPEQPLEAATVDYVKDKADTVNAGKFAVGSLPVTALPGLEGDVLHEEGKDVVSLKPTSIPNGSTHVKVTVNNKGQVTNNAVLIETDIPSLTFDHVEKNRPTTLSGYGITDALPETGGTLTGKLKVVEVAEESNSLVNLSYLEDQLGSGGGGAVPTGGIIYRNSSITPSGFLKCNGGELSKSAYPELYSSIGDEFGNEDYKGFGQHWKLQHGVSDVEVSGNLSWSPNVVSLPRATFQHGLAVSKNRVYIIGGATGGSNGVAYNTVFSAPVDDKGIIGAWVSEPNLPGYRHSPAVCLINNFVYVIGGFHNASGYLTVYRAEIKVDGTLNAWVTLANVPEGSYGRELLVIKNKLVIIGGIYRTHHYADLNADGSVGTWTAGTNLLPVAPAYTSSFIVKDKLYILGSANTSVYVSDIQTDGTLGEFTVANTLPVNPSISDVAVINDKVYVFTGTSTGVVYRADVNLDGTIGNWTLDSTIGLNCSGHRVAIVKNRIYSIGGSGSTTGTRYCSITGGTSDYSTWYDAKYIVSDSDKFRLPDISSKLYNTNAFIKF